MKWPEDFVNKIICGDCLEIMKEMPSECVDLIITSPPYNLHLKHGHEAWTKSIQYGHYTDNLPEEQYQKWQIKCINQMIRITKSTGSVFYNHKPRIRNHIVILPTRWIDKTRAFIKQIIIWDRNSTPVIDPIRFYPTTEWIFHLIKIPQRIKFNSDYSKYKEVWKIPYEINTEHPAPFPVELVNRCLLACSNENDVILDPFLGSGTTIEACKLLHRNFIGIEINPDYCKTAEERLVQGVL